MVRTTHLVIESITNIVIRLRPIQAPGPESNLAERLLGNLKNRLRALEKRGCKKQCSKPDTRFRKKDARFFPKALCSRAPSCDISFRRVREERRFSKQIPLFRHLGKLTPQRSDFLVTGLALALESPGKPRSAATGGRSNCCSASQETLRNITRCKA